MSKQHDNTAPTVFPEIPRDNVTLGLLSSLKDLTLKISHNNMLEKDPELQKICGYLFVISDAPVNHPYAYFRFHEALKDESFKIGEYYNYYIFSQGQDYMLEVLNKEIGPFADYFNEFQVIMYGLNSLAKGNKAYDPFSNLLWGFYSSMYSSSRRKVFLQNAMDALQRFADEDRLASEN